MNDPTVIPLLDGTASIVGYGNGVVLLMRGDGKPGMVYNAVDVPLLIEKLQTARQLAVQHVTSAAGGASRAEPPAADPTVSTSSERIVPDAINRYRPRESTADGD